MNAARSMKVMKRELVISRGRLDVLIADADLGRFLSPCSNSGVGEIGVLDATTSLAKSTSNLYFQSKKTTPSTTETSTAQLDGADVRRSW